MAEQWGGTRQSESAQSSHDHSSQAALTSCAREGQGWKFMDLLGFRGLPWSCRGTSSLTFHMLWFKGHGTEKAAMSLGLLAGRSLLVVTELGEPHVCLGHSPMSLLWPGSQPSVLTGSPNLQPTTCKVFPTSFLVFLLLLHLKLPFPCRI